MKTVIPFIHGKGKSGQAKTGADRVLIKDTIHYPNAFVDFKAIISKLEAQFKQEFPGENMPNIQKQLLNLVNQATSHVYELEVCGQTVIFLNLDMFKGRDFNYLSAITVDGQKIKI